MSENEATDSGTKPPKHRSPSYPAIDLEQALMRARQLWDLAGRHRTRVPAVLDAWGYSRKSSGGLVTLAALKKFGLLEDEGARDARQVWLSRLGHELTFFGQETGEWLERAQTAALTPTIHRELWQEYGPTLPDDRVILPNLVLERAFGEGAARELLDEFRRTIAFARLTDTAATVAENGQDAEQDNAADLDALVAPAVIEASPEAPLIQAPSERAMRTVQVTYSPSEWALLQGRFPMSEDDWDAMIAVLNAMKRGLVAKPKNDE